MNEFCFCGAEKNVACKCGGKRRLEENAFFVPFANIILVSKARRMRLAGPVANTITYEMLTVFYS
jgi:hypothetical protein